MVNWNNLQQATSPNAKPTPGWLFNEICQDVKMNPKDCADVAEYLMQCVCSDQLNIQLKAVLAIKHLAAEVTAFQQYMLACPGALKIMQDIAAPPIVPQARAIEPQDVKTVRDATEQALKAINTPHTVEKHTESAGLKQRIQGFGNFEPPPEEAEKKPAGVAGQVGDFVADSIGDVVDDFREKGAVGALKDATIDALDLMLDGVDAVWGWVAGKKDSDQPRICQPVAPVGGIPGGGMAPGMYAGAQNQFQPPMPPTSSANHYAAAFGGGVVGANNPIMMNPGQLPGSSLPGVSPPAAKAPPPEPEPAKPPPAPMVDLLSMDQPEAAQSQGGANADLLGDMGGSQDPKAAPDLI
mmetsp:Transcript_60215/g.143534  ORF Transcript_60215/g.143534 Transcript_60215/m.143534 type:complete len:353 (-) Transcript_60215:102-1160(-)